MRDFKGLSQRKVWSVSGENSEGVYWKDGGQECWGEERGECQCHVEKIPVKNLSFYKRSKHLCTKICRHTYRRVGLPRQLTLSLQMFVQKYLFPKIFVLCRKIFDKIDKDADGKVSEEELKNWIKYVQNKYIIEDTERQWKEHQLDDNGQLTWAKYKERTYGYLESKYTQTYGYLESKYTQTYGYLESKYTQI